METENIPVKIWYTGIDLVEWPQTGLMDIARLDDVTVKQYLGIGMQDFWAQMQTFMANILFFPKILSEGLDEGENSIIDQFCNNLKNAQFGMPYVILCISHT